jgi:hypothetical protein
MTAKQMLLAAVEATPDDSTFERNLVGNLSVLAKDGTQWGYIDLRTLTYVRFNDPQDVILC